MKRIMIVEDEIALRTVYSMLFKKQGFKVHEVMNGKDALEALDKARPDIILLDILMPIMSGIEFLEQAKLKQRYPGTKVLVLSNLSDPKTLNDIYKLGADQYVLKASVSPKALLECVESLLKTA